MPRRTYNWYIAQGLKPPAGMKPKKTGYERKTYNWYVQRMITPPVGLKPPKNARPLGTAAAIAAVAHTPVATDAWSSETVEQIDARIKARFAVLETLVTNVIEGDVRALIVSGPPGLGKSFTVESGMKDQEANCRITKGFTRATGLYKLLYEYRAEGSILVFDDADSVFDDVVALNLLKTALDTTEERVISWLSERKFVDEGGDELPNTFTFEGSIIFITNLDFDALIVRGSKISEHLKALISRCHYIDMTMKSTRDFIVRIKQVIRDTKMLGMLTKLEQQDVMEFIEANQDKLREISLRTALKVATLRKTAKDWKNMAQVTCCRQ